ncbi:MAG: tetratricopeptide repeat protein [Thermomicrobiales bacterium]
MMPAPPETASSQPPPLTIQLFGGFQVTIGATPIPASAWRLRKAASLVKLLALAPGQRLPREQVLEALWPDLEPAAALNNLRYTLHIARQILEAPPHSAKRALHLQDEQLLLRPAGELRLDTETFAAAVVAARRTADPAAYEAALALYPGELLPEDQYEDWAAGQREAFRDTALALLSELAARYEARGDQRRAIAALERLVRWEPAHEEATIRLMRLLTAAGQQSQALRQYARLRSALRRELDADPAPSTQQFYTAILARRETPAALPASTPGPQNNLPAPLTSFVGRAQALDELTTILTSAPPAPRLVTLTGTGGCGKTRLALEVARALATTAMYPDGIWFVDLAPLTDAALLPGAVLRAVGTREAAGGSPLDLLTSRLRDTTALLVLDNCEHLIAGCAELAATLLTACPHLRLLATSREALRIPGELHWRVPSLPLPEVAPASAADDLQRNDAVRLFVERARLARPDFVPSAADIQAIVAVCRQLDGIPLAIELAAARAAVLTPAQIATRLDRALELLTHGSRTAPSRQQTLRATLDWSYALLDEAERVLLRRLAVFAGGWTVEAAEAVCAGAGVARDDVLLLLALLVEKSLLQIETDDTAMRYRFLEPMRQYAAGRLAASADAEPLAARHAAHFLALAEQAAPELRGRDQTLWLNRLTQDYDNLRAVLRWAIATGAIDTEARLCTALARFWYVRGYFSEGGDWLSGALQRGERAGIAPALLASLLRGAGTLAWGQGELMRATEIFERCQALCEATGDQANLAATLHSLGVLAEGRGEWGRAMAYYDASVRLKTELGDRMGLAMTLQTMGNVVRNAQGDRQRATDLYEQSLALQRELGDKGGIAIALGSLGIVAYEESDYARSIALSQEALAIFRELAEKPNIINALIHLGRAALAQGDQRQALVYFSDSLRLAQQIGDQRGIANNLEGLGRCALQGNQHSRAARLWGAAAALRVTKRISAGSTDQQDTDHFTALVRAALGEAAYSAAWQAGYALTPDEAIAEALRPAAEQATAPAAETAGGTPLSPREQQIAHLIARGYTNGQIATAIGIASRTVDTHASRILHKLGVASRADVAARLGPGTPATED